VAEQGSYEELSSHPDGAFTKLMEWQMSGGDASQAPKTAPVSPETEEKLSELDREESERQHKK